jgi:alpha-glucoside transport system permease protein
LAEVGLPVRGLELEVTGREITGRPVTGRPRRPYGLLLLALPAVPLVALLLVPIGITTYQAFHTRAGLGFRNFRDAFHAVGAGPAIWHSAGWIVVGLALVAVGFGIALAGRGVPWLWRILRPALVIPFAVSALVAGSAFRIVFDPAPEKGTVTALTGHRVVWLGPGWIWVVLIAAFAWMWLGFAVSLFRAGLDAIPEDVIRTGRAEGLRRWRGLRAIELPILRPITGVVVVTSVVAAVRVFDLVLVAVPGSVQGKVNVLGLLWWRTVPDPDAPGRQAALAVVLYAVAAAVALLGMRGLRRSWAMPAEAPDVPAASADERESADHPRKAERADPASRAVGTDRAPGVRPTGSALESPRRWRALLVGVPVALLWAFPLLVLVATAFHTPRAAGLAGWWQPRGLGLDSFWAASYAGLWRALLVTLLIAGLATLVMLAVAVPTAYLLAWGGLPPWLGRLVTAGLVVLAVTPVQMYAGPLRDAFALLGGSRIPLAFVHAAAGLPLAVLLLRKAFASAPPDLVVGALLGRLGQGSVLNQVRRTARPALVAVAVLEFVLVWNDFIIGFLIAGPGSTTSSLVLWGEARQFATSAGPVAAAAVLSSVVPVTLLLATWPTVVRGLTVGTRL